MAMSLIRLDKYLADMKAGTRSEVKEYIRKGRVQVDEITVKKPEQKVDIMTQKVFLDGRMIGYVTMEYYMLNKPSGVLTATMDKNAKTVLDLMDVKRKDLFPVGRLDKDTEGLLLITNDGELAFKSGVSATITGNMLTTVACATIRSDRQLLKDMGRDVTPDYWKNQKN